MTGTPSSLSPSGSEGHDPSIEEEEQPHVEMGAAVRAELGDEDDGGDDSKRVVVHGRITNRDLKTYGFTEGCPRCRDIQRGFNKTKKHHAETCRLRIYQSWKDNGDKKYSIRW